jgi:hypothetical protein
MELTFWGLWDVPLARTFGDAIERAVGEMAASGAPYVAISDSSRHPPQREEVQAIKLAKMQLSQKLGGHQRNAIVIAENAVGQMQVQRLLRESGKNDLTRMFSDAQKAREWIFGADVFMRKGGDERAGFTVHPNPAIGLISASFWGLWDLAIADAFRIEITRATEEMNGRHVALVDARRFPAQREDVQAIHRETMAIGVHRGLARVADLIDSSVSRMQARRLFEEAGSPSHLRFFTDHAEARAWLAEVIPAVATAPGDR